MPVKNAKPAAKREPRPKKAAATSVSVPPKEEHPAEPAAETGTDRYWEAVGRRKTAIARVRLYTKGEKGFWVNEKPLTEYFPYAAYQKRAAEAMELMKSGERFRISARVKGGGPNAQAEAVRHGIARALILFNLDFRKRLKRAGFLTRDPRMKERKKFGLKKARRAPQWQKR